MQSLYSPSNLYSGFNYYWFDSEVDFANQDLELRVLTNPYDNVTPQLDLETALEKLGSPKKDFETVLIDKKLNFIWKVTRRIKKLVRFDTSEARRVLKEWHSAMLEAEPDSDSLSEASKVADIFTYDQFKELHSFLPQASATSEDFNILSLERGQFGIETKYQMFDEEKGQCMGIVARTIGLDEVALKKSNQIPGWLGFKRVGDIRDTGKLLCEDHDYSKENMLCKSSEQVLCDPSSDEASSVFSTVNRHSLDGGAFTDARYQPIEFLPAIPGPNKIDKYDEADTHPSVPTYCDSDYKMLRRSLYEPRLCYYSLHEGVHFVTPRFLPGHQNPNKRNHDYFLIAIDECRFEHLTPTQKCQALFTMWKSTRHYFEINSVPVETLIGHENSLAEITKRYGRLNDATLLPALAVNVEKPQSAPVAVRRRNTSVSNIMQKLLKNIHKRRNI
ncbi:AaceriAFR380Cp [[Ashbya] aceris (nom. inval.)]|nr:AaceriAFR380Cp [[Ashbya] aceris (nom. inval.)]